jgi:hypothetical protein
MAPAKEDPARRAAAGLPGESSFRGEGHPNSPYQATDQAPHPAAEMRPRYLAARLHALGYEYSNIDESQTALSTLVNEWTKFGRSLAARPYVGLITLFKKGDWICGTGDQQKDIALARRLLQPCRAARLVGSGLKTGFLAVIFSCLSRSGFNCQHDALLAIMIPRFGKSGKTAAQETHGSTCLTWC